MLNRGQLASESPPHLLRLEFREHEGTYSDRERGARKDPSTKSGGSAATRFRVSACQRKGSLAALEPTKLEEGMITSTTYTIDKTNFIWVATDPHNLGTVSGTTTTVGPIPGWVLIRRYD